MRTLTIVPMDDTARQAVEMAALTARSEVLPYERIDPDAPPEGVTIAITTSPEADLRRLERFRRGTILLFPDPEDRKNLAEALLKSECVLIPVRVESLARIAFSEALKHVEMLFVKTSPDDFMLEEENLFDVLRLHTFHRFFHAEGRQLREAVLRMAHRIRSLRAKESIAYVLRIPLQTQMYMLDEALDVLEVAMPPESPMLFAIRHEKEASRVRVSALVGSPFHVRSDLQTRIDAQPTYLGKTAVIVEQFAANAIDERRMEELCRENGIEPDDADRLYDLVYVRSDETAELIRHLRTETNAARIQRIAETLAEGFIDVKILEELTYLFDLPADTIIARAEEIRKKTTA